MIIVSGVRAIGDMRSVFIKLVVFLSLSLAACAPSMASPTKAKQTAILDEISGLLTDFNYRMGIEPIPVSGRANARFSRFEPQHGFMEHWGSALRTRWSVRLLNHSDGRTFVLYQFLMGFPDSSSTEQIETRVKLWFFERSTDGVYRPVLLEEVMDESPLLFRFGQNGALSAMDDGLHFVPYRWNGKKLVRQ